MADEVADSSRSGSGMDLNLYLGLRPLPPPPPRVLSMDLALDFTTQLQHSANQAARTHDLGRLLPSAEPSPAMFSPSNALSTAEPPPFDPLLFALFDRHSMDNEESFNVVEPVRMTIDASSEGANVSLPLPTLELEGGVQMFGELPRPSLLAPAAGRVEMVAMSELRQPMGVAEEMAPELRLQRLIQVSERHQVARSGARDRRGNSPETDRLIWAITRSHSNRDAARLYKQDTDGKDGDAVAGHKNQGGCICGACFECNICLDPAREPVVTRCGHLFCWACLYKWLHAHSGHSECPVCKGEVLEVNVTPIYGRGGGERDASGDDIPPRPPANRSESLRQQLQGSDSRDVARRFAENQELVRAQIAHVGVEVSVHPAGRSRARGRRRQRQGDNALPPIPTIVLHAGNGTQESGNQVPLPSSNTHGAGLAAPSAPRQSASTDQASTSSTMAVIVGPRRRTGSSESTRRTRRRQN